MDTIFVSLVFFILFIFLAIGAVLVYTYAWSCLLSRYSWEEEGSEEFEISTEGLVGIGSPRPKAWVPSSW